MNRLLPQNVHVLEVKMAGFEFLHPYGVTQLVDGTKSVHGMLAKSMFTR